MPDHERLVGQIEAALARLELRRLKRPVQGDAAVLIPILLVEPEPRLLLTRRTETVGSHKGQISFPGGMRDEGESEPVVTALRETKEELGIEPDQFSVLGRFHEYLSITNYRVSPVVAVHQGIPEFRPNRTEVARILQIPLSFFQQTEPRIEIHRRNKRQVSIYFYDFGEETVWGLTAGIIHDFCELL